MVKFLKTYGKLKEKGRRCFQRRPSIMTYFNIFYNFSTAFAAGAASNFCKISLAA